MSSKKYASPLRLTLKPSRSLLLLYSFIGLGAFVLVLIFPWPPLSRWLLSLLILLGYGYIQMQHIVLKFRSSVVEVIWDTDDLWYLTRADGQMLPAVLLGDSYLHPGLVILNFKQPGRRLRRSVLLTADRVDANTLRQLRVRLKLSGLGENAADVVR